ncbi:hypothetical protein F5Y18DRAFT_391270 [Xylariaceae sp. FL1019]|nr:hypothetical protein F5Y18DRAFT_391270 [Xylariaceae sp. FL1019]
MVTRGLEFSQIRGRHQPLFIRLPFIVAPRSPTGAPSAQLLPPPLPPPPPFSPRRSERGLNLSPARQEAYRMNQQSLNKVFITILVAAPALIYRLPCPVNYPPGHFLFFLHSSSRTFALCYPYAHLAQAPPNGVPGKQGILELVWQVRRTGLRGTGI